MLLHVDRVIVGVVIWLTVPKMFEVTRDGQVTAPEVSSEIRPRYKLIDVLKKTQGCPELEV